MCFVLQAGLMALKLIKLKDFTSKCFVILRKRKKKTEEKKNNGNENDCRHCKTRSNHMKGSKERYLLGQNTTCEFSG